MQHKFLILSLTFMLVSCVETIPQSLHLYRYYAGSHEIDGKETDHADLIYYGEKHESLESAAYNWHQFAAKKCFNGKYVVTGTKAFIPAGNKSSRIEEVLVFFAEPDQWPQVYASYRCEWPR